MGHGGIQAGLAHFTRIGDGKRHLLLERLHAPIPELRLVLKRVQNSRRVALADATFDADRDGSPVSESARRVVARTASNGSINRQATVEEKILAERDFLRSLRIVRRLRRKWPRLEHPLV